MKEIRWNNEELKAEIAEKMQEYKSLAFTEETIKEAKADRAKLNKLRTALKMRGNGSRSCVWLLTMSLRSRLKS